MANKDTQLQLRISKEKKKKLFLIANENGLKVTDIVDVLVQKTIDDYENGKLDSGIKAKAFDRLMKKQGVLKFEDIEIREHY